MIDCRCDDSRRFAWISVEDRLPKGIGECLTYNGEAILWAFYNSDGRWASENMFIKNVTHWMSLPAAPEYDNV